MRDFTADTITQAVLDSVADTPDPRLRETMGALVRHLHAFVREVEPSFAEWQAAIAFLTHTGQMCDAHRQEFILLSDTLGVSMLVDAINHRMPPGATETTVLGPFYVQSAPEMPDGADISGGLPGEPLVVTGRVSSADGTPLPGATVDVWHADEDGFYDVQHLAQTGGSPAAPGSAPTRRGGSPSARSCRTGTRSPPTGRWGTCWPPQGAIRTAPPTSIS